MTIAANTWSFYPEYETDFANYLHEILLRLANQQPQHRFILFCNEGFRYTDEYSANSERIYLANCTKHTLVNHAKFLWKLKGEIKKNSPDILFQNGIINRFKGIQHFIIPSNPGFITDNKNQIIRNKKYYKNYAHKKAEFIVPTNPHKEALVNELSLSHKIINVVPPGTPVLHSDHLSPELTRKQYAEGCDYFICAGENSNPGHFTKILQAFTLFKKRLKSNMKFILYTSNQSVNASLKELLSNYTLKDEVKIVETNSQKHLLTLIMSSYAYIGGGSSSDFGSGLIAAMYLGTLVIAEDRKVNKEYCGDAALYFDMQDQKGLSEKMMLVYKDEAYRKTLISKGKAQGSIFTWEASISRVWNLVEAKSA
ncbi:hypothetical protein BH20BAC1_BH20BAC1_06880 [soil metagenome]